MHSLHINQINMGRGKILNHLKLLFFCVMVLSIISCEKDPQPEPYLGDNYFPLIEGKWIIYSIDSIVYNEFTQSIDTFKFELKEKTGSVFIDNAGNESRQIERYKRNSANEKWELSDIWVSTVNEARAEVVEENLKFVKLIFPVKKNKTWNGNAFNNMEAWDYEYISTHHPESINNVSFDSTLTVQQIESYNLIETKNYKEIYAANIGLVSKEFIDVKTEVNGVIKSGFKFYQSIKSYGVN